MTIADPDATGVVTLEVNEFLQNWTGGDSIQEEGVILLMEPTAAFFSKEVDRDEKITQVNFWETVKMYKGLLWVLGISVVALTFLTVIFPLFLQMTVDESIEHQNEDLLFVVFGAWFILLIAQIGMDFVKRFTLFHIGSKVNIQLITNFMRRVLSLPMRFFDARMADDVTQTFMTIRGSTGS